MTWRQSAASRRVSALKKLGAPREEAWSQAPVTKKAKLVARMSMLTGESKGVCSLQYDALMAVMEYELMQGNQVNIPLIGRFQIKETEKRLHKDTCTGDYYIIPPRRYVRFRFNAVFKRRVKNLTDEWTPPY